MLKKTTNQMKLRERREKGKKTNGTNRKGTGKKRNSNISIIILNICDLKIPIKKQRWSQQIQEIKKF